MRDRKNYMDTVELSSLPTETTRLHPRSPSRELFFPALPETLYRRLVRLPGKAWAVYQVVRYRTRRTQHATLLLSTRGLLPYGLSQHHTCHALRALEVAALLTRSGGTGRQPCRVTLTRVKDLPPLRPVPVCPDDPPDIRRVEAPDRWQFFPTLSRSEFLALVPLPGQSWAVYLLLKLRLRRTRRVCLPASPIHARCFDISRQQHRTAVAALRQAGLLTVVWAHPRQSPRVVVHPPGPAGPRVVEGVPDATLDQ
jgi:hypothetical protein